MWFRSDLRIYDNPALAAAMQKGECIAVYCLCHEQWDAHDVSPAKRSLIVRQLVELESALSRLNVPLIVLDCKIFERVPEALADLCARLGIGSLCFNHEYELNERRCARAVRDRLVDAGVEVAACHDQCALKPGSVLNNDGKMYKVFSAFKRAYLKAFTEQTRAMMNRPTKQSPSDIPSELDALDPKGVASPWDDQWPAGEDEAHDRLNRFVEHRIKQYKTRRDFPADEATSELSPYLAVGAISTVQCLHAAITMNHGELSGGHPGIDTWISELIWRDFYRHLLYSFPELCQYQAFKPETDALPWRHDEALFEAWKSGKTGYPIVDAAMRQLSERAWMHNRLRMVCAMFLTKHLFIDWRWGERYFMQTLVDGDLASNNGGWQWSASTGVDAVPYFRIFNPVRQSERFDPDGEFVRKYVKELASVEGKSVHMPDNETARKLGYPEPIVDHKTAVAQTKTWFKELSGA